MKSMKYTFITAEGKEQTVSIPEEVLMQHRKAGLSMREAIDLFLSDEGYITNPVVEELTAKAKANGVNGAGKTSSGKRKPPTRKPDETKRALIVLLEDALKDNADGPLRIANIEVTNIERIIAFTIGDDKYELTLSKKRKPKT